MSKFFDRMGRDFALRAGTSENDCALKSQVIDEILDRVENPPAVATEEQENTEEAT